MKKVSLLKFLPLVLVLGMVACSKPTSSPAPASSSPAPSQQSTQPSSSQAPSSQAPSSSRPSSSQASSSSRPSSSQAPSSQTSQGSSSTTQPTDPGFTAEAQMGYNLYALRFTTNANGLAIANSVDGKTEGGEDALLSDNTEGKDKDWAQRDLYAVPKPAEGETAAFASYIEAVNGTGTSQMNVSTRRVNKIGYYPIGNINNNYGAKITFTVTVSGVAANTEVGLYGQFCQKTAAGTLGQTTKVYVNGVELTSAANAVLPQGSNYAASNIFSFMGYVNLKPGTNTITFQYGSQAPAA